MVDDVQLRRIRDAFNSGNAHSVALPVEKAREVVDTSELPEDALVAMDQAQGAVFAGDTKRAFVIIEIVPD